jgi:16S rRNA (adenine(1408)-N(1))-methyltransferase
VGTGDGRAVVAIARRRPEAVVIGLDPVASAMAEASRRAARRAARGGLPNAMFVAAAAERPPAELAGRAGLVTVTLPWGSLLRGMVGRDDAVTAGVASLVRPGGSIQVLLAPDGRDIAALAGPLAIEGEAAAIGDAWARAGVRLVELRPAADREIAETGSTWARRLDLVGADPARAGAVRDRRASGDGRIAWRLGLERAVEEG